MSGIDVQAIDDGALIFTVTAHDQAPWGRSNTTIFVTAADLEVLIDKLQAHQRAIQQQRASRPAFVPGQVVHIVGSFRTGQRGKVIDVRQKEARLQRASGQLWSYTVYFDDDATWDYTATELERVT